MNITVYDEIGGTEQCTVMEMSSLAPNHIPLKERVPGVEGQAFELKSWYDAWMNKRQVKTDREPVYMNVEAVDEFQATIPWEQLNQAVFLYEQDGKPLQKGFPIRLYVPDGSSECLNVKSVVSIRFEYGEAVNEASYGFKNRVSIEELRLNK
ncbi:molybdopterin-dependent oxidoreductase [Paenibacillus sp. RC67]|uniref:molybdopterin-dependent oxidoreductase n=1 Tax=Paenibacillus sp. RC67 TaxID=3039392 RepID=UPI0024AD2244|nr:molybdopterin-dependent oxidoreductase [Paenibacillus sp. RC67]